MLSGGCNFYQPLQAVLVGISTCSELVVLGEGPYLLEKLRLKLFGKQNLLLGVRGAFVRSLPVLWEQVAYQVKVTLMEVYNEQLRDLLAAPSSNGDARRLDIRSTAASGTNVPNATQVRSGSGAAQL